MRLGPRGRQRRLSAPGAFDWLPLHGRDDESFSAARTYPSFRRAAAWVAQAVNGAKRVRDEKLDVLVKGSLFNWTPIVLLEEGTHAHTLTTVGAVRPTSPVNFETTISAARLHVSRS